MCDTDHTTPVLITVDPTRYVRPGTRQQLPANTLVSRADARRLGFQTYMTGRPCSAGHVSPRYVGNATCVACCVEGYRAPNALADARRQEAERLEAVAAEHNKRIVSRDEARLMNSTVYFTAKPCRAAGHIDYRYVSSSNCAACVREAQRLIRAKRAQS